MSIPIPTTRTAPDADPPTGWSSAETAQEVLEYLRGVADGERIASVSIRDVGIALGIAAVTARRALSRLCAHNQIELLRLGTGGRYRSRYRLLDRAAQRQVEPVA